MESKLSTTARASVERVPAGQCQPKHQGRGIVAFALHFDSAAGEHVLSCLYRTPESSTRQTCEVARSNGGDLLAAMARSLATEHGVPLWETADALQPTSSVAGHPTAAGCGSRPRGSDRW